MPPTRSDSADNDGVLQVLLGEQKHIDTQIETMMDLQIKLLAVLFPVLAAAAGWIFGTDEKHILSDSAEGGVLLVLIAVMCFGILLSVICYSLSAEYSRYKSEVLGPRFQEILNSGNSLDGRSWGKSEIGKTLGLAIAGLWTTISAALCIGLAIATRLLRVHASFTIDVSLCLSYFVTALSLLSVVFSLIRGAKRVGRRSPRH